jgi:DNA-binding NtrC family response regulator
MQTTQPQAASPTVLIVDDEPSTVRLCAQLLEQAGFTVLTAEGSSDALKICTAHQGPIDLLLTDLVLSPPGFQLASPSNQFPHVHGHVLAARAAALRNGLRVALMSGNPDQDLASHGIMRSPLPFLKKPFERAALVEFVREVLASPAPSCHGSTAEKSADDVGWVD